MKTRLFLSVLMLVAMTSLTFGSTEITSVSSELRSVKENFYGIILHGNANVYLLQGDANSIKVEGAKQNLHDVETSVSNGTLEIKTGSLRNVNVYVTMTDVNLIEVNGNGVINVKSAISSDMLLIKVIGDGIINADVRTLSLGMIVNGGGRIYVKGITGDSFVKVKGSGKVVAINLDSLREASKATSATSSSQKAAVQEAGKLLSN